MDLVFSLPEEKELYRQREWPRDITKGVHILWEWQLTSELKNSQLLGSFRSESLKVPMWRYIYFYKLILFL